MLDTRTPGSGPLTAGAAFTVPIGGRRGVPANARAVFVNVTVANPSTASWLAVSPDGGDTPTTVSYVAGRVTAALAVVPLSAGNLELRLGAGTANVLLDVTGYVPPQNDTDGRLADYVTTGPTRLLDTRTSAPIVAGRDLRVPLTGHAGMPAGATAVLATVTVIKPTASGFMTAYPTGATPATSTLKPTTSPGRPWPTRR